MPAWKRASSYIVKIEYHPWYLDSGFHAEMTEFYLLMKVSLSNVDDFKRLPFVDALLPNSKQSTAFSECTLFRL